MTLTLSIRLITQTYGATPWNTAHIEGKNEWPPSPWRLFRALMAAYYLCPNKPDVEVLGSAISRFCQEYPEFYLPPVTSTQHRYYRKDQTNDTDLYRSGKKVIEAQLRFHPEANILWVRWNRVEMVEQELEALKQILPYCRYLGRSEYLADWQITHPEEMPSPNAIPSPEGKQQVLVPRRNLSTLELLLNLQQSPRYLRAEVKTEHIPGGEWVNYQLLPQKVLPSWSASLPNAPTYARFAVFSKPTPIETDALMWCEKLHQALVQRCPSPNFLGKDAEGNPLGTQTHAYLLPEIDASGHITHLVCACPAGFSSKEVEALLSVRRLWQKKGEVLLRLVTLAKWEHYHSEATCWISSTPFFLPRHPKYKKTGVPKLLPTTNFQQDGAEHQALRLLLHLPEMEHYKNSIIEFRQEDNRLALLVNREPVAWCNAEIFPYWWMWKHERRTGENKRGAKEGFRLELELATPINGILALGYGAHFGLGLMAPVRGPVAANWAILQKAHADLI